MTLEHNPYYDGRSVFGLDVKMLRSGDIILTRNRRNKSKIARAQSWIIAAAAE